MLVIAIKESLDVYLFLSISTYVCIYVCMYIYVYMQILKNTEINIMLKVVKLFEKKYINCIKCRFKFSEYD